jgi:hypothetical protein
VCVCVCVCVCVFKLVRRFPSGSGRSTSLSDQPSICRKRIFISSASRYHRWVDVCVIREQTLGDGNFPRTPDIPGPPDPKINMDLPGPVACIRRTIRMRRLASDRPVHDAQHAGGMTRRSVRSAATSWSSTSIPRSTGRSIASTTRNTAYASVDTQFRAGLLAMRLRYGRQTNLPT